MANDKILEVKDLSVSFNTYAGEVKAVRGVSFELNRGETLAFVGESGCGKTVTAKSILRLLKPPFAVIKEGSKITCDGKDVLSLNKKELRQRVMIAMALACSPKILIADEPTTALDVTIQAQIMDLMRELKEKMNTAIILVTHDLGVVANFADRIQVMYAGQVVERGTAREIFYDSKHPYTWALLSSVPKLAKESQQELYALKGTPPDLILPLNHCPFASRCEYCMPICKEKNPLETTITDTHRVSCWLQHPNAPKVKSFYDREAK